MTAARAIGIVGNPPRSIPLLIRHLEDPPAREVSVTAARVLGGDTGTSQSNRSRQCCAKEIRQGASQQSMPSGGLSRGERTRHWHTPERRGPGGPGKSGYHTHETARSEHVAEHLRQQAREEKEVSMKSSVGQAGREEIDTLITALNDRSVEVQASAATRLIAMGRPAAEGLLRVLKDDDPELQRAAAGGVLGEMREAAVEPLMDALNDTDRFVRLVAARNLGNIGDARAIEALSGSLKSERDSAVRAAVAEASGTWEAGRRSSR
ncbi:HEAT repeat domain-containing protein [Methanoculleus chikugoensis]|uniref:HEAT repeat domain-containing protein n=1 Tax=Methanoculleus chikugoensis TaxID=118126 RepID=UPI0006D222B5|nr:HEAT repeat domain-containing protein [Methanoculleus chikugoensis]